MLNTMLNIVYNMCVQATVRALNKLYYSVMIASFRLLVEASAFSMNYLILSRHSMHNLVAEVI